MLILTNTFLLVSNSTKWGQQQRSVHGSNYCPHPQWVSTYSLTSPSMYPPASLLTSPLFLSCYAAHILTTKAEIFHHIDRKNSHCSSLIKQPKLTDQMTKGGQHTKSWHKTTLPHHFTFQHGLQHGAPTLALSHTVPPANRIVESQYEGRPFNLLHLVLARCKNNTACRTSPS